MSADNFADFQPVISKRAMRRARISRESAQPTKPERAFSMHQLPQERPKHEIQALAAIQEKMAEKAGIFGEFLTENRFAAFLIPNQESEKRNDFHGLKKKTRGSRRLIGFTF